MTWLTVPSYRWTASIMCSSTGSRILRASSGSRSASSSIEPLRSAKSTVTCLRSPSRAALEVRIFSARCLGVYVSGVPKVGACGAGEVVSAAPQPPQNFTPGSLENPQDGHASAKGAPHSAQNLRPALLVVPHRGQFIPCRYLRLLLRVQLGAGGEHAVCRPEELLASRAER